MLQTANLAEVMSSGDSAQNKLSKDPLSQHGETDKILVGNLNKHNSFLPNFKGPNNNAANPANKS